METVQASRVARRVALFFISCVVPLTCTSAALRPGDFVMASPPWSGDRLVVLDGSSSVATEIASGGYLPGMTDLVVNASGNVLVTVQSAGIVQVNPSTGEQTLFASVATLGGGRPSGITLGPGGSVFVSMQSASPRVVELSSGGEFTRIVTSGGYLPLPAGLAFGHDGALYVCTTIADRQVGGGGIVRVEPGSGAQPIVTPTIARTWGHLKAIYR